MTNSETHEGTKTIAGTNYSITRYDYYVKVEGRPGRHASAWSVVGPRGGATDVVEHIDGGLISMKIRKPNATTVFQRKGIEFHQNADKSLGWTTLDERRDAWIAKRAEQRRATMEAI